MGIPGLARRLEPYAAQHSPGALDGYSAIIDGPALAYFGHRLALAASTDVAKLPSYKDVIRETIRWLDHLESINIRVSNIVFDGALPGSKQVERIARLEQNNKRVQQLRASYPTESCPIPRTLGSISYAFLAPALREALKASPYAARTSTAPGEADDWCAIYATDINRSVIFTSDTDLVLYDYPKETLVVFLHEVDLLLSIRTHSPEQMRQKLQLDSLVQFAYALCQNQQDTATVLIQNARSVNMKSDRYLDFSRRYTLSTMESANRRQNSCNTPFLQDLDVRVSEFVDQALCSSTRPLVYLPLLVEDPGHASAWNIGHDVRKLAYSLLASETSVDEYRRKAQGVLAHEIKTDSQADQLSGIRTMEQQVRALTLWATTRDIGSGLLWPLFGLSLVLADLNTAPAISLALRVLNADFDNTWAFVQLTARLQAALYSLRMLKQIISVRLALQEKNDTELCGHLSSINSQMALFPLLEDMFTVPGQTTRNLAEQDRLKAVVEEIYASVGAQVPSEHVSNKKKKRQARDLDRKRRKAEMRQTLVES